MKTQLHEFYVTRKCTKYEYFTVKAESMEEAKYEAENGFDYYDFTIFPCPSVLVNCASWHNT